MITVREITNELLKAMPCYIVERKGKTNRVEVYTEDRKWGVACQFPREQLGRLALSDCPRIVRVLIATFDRAIQGENNAVCSS